MSVELKLSDQELKVVNFLVSRNNGNVFWEELAQFAKTPETVKLKTIKKTVSEIKRKYATAGLPVPFNITFHVMPHDKEEDSNEEDDELAVTAGPDGNLPVLQEAAKEQTLVQVKRTVTGNSLMSNGPSAPAQTQSTTTHPAHTEFVIDRNSKRVRTKYGSHLLNDSEWELFKYIHNNVGKLIPISELRDKVVYPQWGSKTPARWFDAIMRIINNIRRQIPGMDKRLLTVKSVETSYLFQ